MSIQTTGRALVLLRNGRAYQAEDAVYEDGMLHARARRRRHWGPQPGRDVTLEEPRSYSWPRESIREIRWSGEAP